MVILNFEDFSFTSFYLNNKTSNPKNPFDNNEDAGFNMATSIRSMISKSKSLLDSNDLKIANEENSGGVKVVDEEVQQQSSVLLMRFLIDFSGRFRTVEVECMVRGTSLPDFHSYIENL